MSEFPRYDRYPADILADTQHLTLAEYGAYNRLLDTMWLQGARLPNNVQRLGRIVGASGRNWQRMWPSLQELFQVSANGRWIVQKRMLEEYEKAQERSASQQAKSNKRWTHRDGKMPTHRDGKMPTQTARNPLTDNKQGDAVAYAPARATPTANNQQDKSEALLKGASSYPLANDLPTSASSAREAERHAAWLHKLAERNRPADPNHPTLIEAEEEQIEQYRRAKHLREKLKAAGFKGLRLMPQ